jgi:hypothetical protein
MAHMRRIAPTAVLAALTALAAPAACSQRGSTPAADPAASGPVQDVHLTGGPGGAAIHMTSSSDPAGVVHAPAPPGQLRGTGCFGWMDAAGTPHWQARMASDSGGHRIRLRLSMAAAGALSPLGTHPTTGAISADGAAVLSVDGADYPGVHPDPGDAMPSYFTVDGDGTTGLISVRFAAVSGGPQAFYAVGRWRCA